MSGSHEKLPKLFWVQIILVVIVGTLYLLAPEATKHVAEASTEAKPVVKKAQHLKLMIKLPGNHVWLMASMDL